MHGVVQSWRTKRGGFCMIPARGGQKRTAHSAGCDAAWGHPCPQQTDSIRGLRGGQKAGLWHPRETWTEYIGVERREWPDSTGCLDRVGWRTRRGMTGVCYPLVHIIEAYRRYPPRRVQLRHTVEAFFRASRNGVSVNVMVGRQSL